MQTEKAISTPNVLESKKWSESFSALILDNIHAIEKAVSPQMSKENKQTSDKRCKPDKERIVPSLKKKPKLTKVKTDDKKAPQKISIRLNLFTILVFQTIQV